MKESRKTFTAELIVALASAGLAALIFFSYTSYLKEQRQAEGKTMDVIEVR